MQFQTNPDATSGSVLTICTGSSVTFTNTSTGFPIDAVYSWTFGGGNPSNALGAGPHSVTFPNLGSHTASLTVDGQSFSIQVNVVDGPTPNYTLGAGSAFSSGLFNNQEYFLACDGSASSFISISSNSQGTDAATVHTINWGNGQPDFVFTGTNFLFHPANNNSSTFYAQGDYILTYTINNGTCIISTEHNIYVGTPPGGSIENSLQLQSFCIPGNVFYNINTQSNGPGTVYNIAFNDGFNTTYTYQHPPPAIIEHEFPINSCGSVSSFDGTTYMNSFSVTMNTSNPCGQATSGIAPIIVSEMPQAEFEISDTVVCVNTPVIFTNASFGGTNVTGGIVGGITGCDTLADVIWTHTPLANVDLLDGDLGTIFSTTIGSQWFPGTESITLSFSEPGTYAISLLVRNKPQCGVDTITKTICVVPELYADFTLQDATVCAPYTFLPENLSNSVECDNANLFQWSVSRSNPQSCPYGGNPGYAFVNGTNTNSFEPAIAFTSPGIYQIQLINTLEFPVPGLLCEGDTIVKTLIVKDIPYITLDSLALCEGSSYTLAPTQSDCYSDNGSIYNWNFAPSSASISSSDLANPSISYGSMGLFTYSVTVSNECGQISQSAPVFIEEGISVQVAGPTTDCINSPLQLNGLISGGVTTGVWSSDLPAGVFLPSPTSLNPSFSFPNGFNGSIAFTLSSDSSVNGCPPALASLVLDINTTIFANAGNYDPLCINSTLNLNGSFGGLATSATWASLNGGTFGNSSSPQTTFTPPVDFVGDITLILTTNDPPNDCQADADTIVLSVVPLPTIIAHSDTTICEGQSLTVFADGGSTYLWNQNLGVGAAHTVSPILPTTYTVIGTDSLGCVNSDTILVNVLPAPDLSPIPNFVYCPQDLTSEIIFSSSFPNAYFNWERTPENIGLALLSSQGNITDFTTVNTTNNLLTSTFTVTPEADNCPGQPEQFTITINPTPQITSVNSQTICPGLSDVVVWETNLDSLLVVSYSWELVTSGSNLSGGLTSGLGDLPSMMLINSGNDAQELVYQIIYHHDSCFGEPFLYSIIVNPGPVLDAIPSQEICSGTLFNDVNFSASVVGTTFSWVLTNVAIPADVNGYPQPSGLDMISGVTVQNIGLDPYDLIYEVTPDALGCSGAPELFVLTVNPELTVSASPAVQYICNNTSSQEVILTSNVANSSVSWEALTIPANIGGVSSNSGVNVIPQFILTNANTQDLEEIEIALVPLNSDPNLCPGDTVLYSIYVFPIPEIDAVSDSIYCSGDFTNPINFTGIATNFAWSHNGLNIGIANSGDNDIASFEITNSEPNQVDVNFTVVPQVTFNNEVCEGNPALFAITINPAGQVNTLPDLIVCDGDSIQQINFTSGNVDGTTQFDWTNSNTTIGIPAAGSGDAIAQFLGLNPSTGSNASLVVVTPSYINSGLICTGLSDTFSISINPIPQIVTIADTFICNSQILNISPQTNIPSSFVWQGEDNPAVNGISLTAQNSAGIDDFLENISASAQTVNYSITPIIPSTGCAGDTNYIEVIVEPYVFMTSPTVYEICSGTSVNSVLQSNIPATYSWFATPNPQVVGATTFTVNSNVIQDTLINISQSPQMLVYTVMPNTISGNCQGAPLIVNVLVNPELQVIAPTNLTLCNNQALSVPLNANANGNFSWFAVQNAGILGETTQIQNTNSINDQLFNTTQNVQQVTYNIVVTSMDLGCTSQNFELTVDVIPTPSVVSPANFTICEDALQEAILPQGTFTALNWTNDNTGTGIAAFANNSPNFASFVAQNANNFPITSNISLTPVYNHNNVSCSGSTQNFSITVNPNGQVNFVPTIEVCHATQIPETVISTSNLTGTTSFTWTNDNLTTGLNLSSGTGNVPSFTGVNTFNSIPNISNISVIASYVHNNVSCPSAPTTFQAIVNPIPTLGAIPNQTYCNGEIVPEFNFFGSGANHYIWNHNNLSIGLPMNGFGNLPQFTANNSSFGTTESTMNVTAYYNSLISNLSCLGNSQSFNITIQPSPFVSFTTDADIYCSRNDVAFYNYSGPNVTFNWYFGDGNSTFVTNPFHEYISGGTYTVTLTATHNGTGCVGTFSAPLTILETPEVNFAVDSAMQCYPGIFNFTDIIQTPFTSSTWHFGDGISVIQNDSVTHVYNAFGCYDVTQIVTSENGCSDSLTITQMVCLFEQPVAYFTTDNTEYNSTNPMVTFFNESEFATSFYWEFGDSTTSTATNPVHTYPEYESGYGIVLTAYNEIGCSDQYGLFVMVREDRLFYIPNAFTPENQDGINDIFKPVISSGYNPDFYTFTIFNRWGELIFETNQMQQGWNGNTQESNSEKPCPDGIYIWQIDIRGITEDDATIYRGHVNLLR